MERLKEIRYFISHQKDLDSKFAAIKSFSTSESKLPFAVQALTMKSDGDLTLGMMTSKKFPTGFSSRSGNGC